MFASAAVICALQFEALGHCLTHEADVACSSCLAGSQYHLYPSASDTFGCDALRTQICWNLESSWNGCACEGFCEAELEEYYQCSMTALTSGNLDCDEDLRCFGVSATNAVGGRNNENEKPKSLSSTGRRHRKLFLEGPIDFLLNVFIWILNRFDIFNIIPNRPPVARNDFATTFLNTPVVIDVLANDYDPDFEDLVVTAIVTPPSNGVAVINANSTVTYTPNTGFLGVDTFEYQVNDVVEDACTLSIGSCNCTGPGYDDDICKIDFGACSEAICNGTTCTSSNEAGTYSCDCTTTWVGADCSDVGVDECAAILGGCDCTGGSFTCVESRRRMAQINDSPSVAGALPFRQHERALAPGDDNAIVYVDTIKDPPVCKSKRDGFKACLAQQKNCNVNCLDTADDALSKSADDPASECSTVETKTCSSLANVWANSWKPCDSCCRVEADEFYGCAIKTRTNGKCDDNFVCLSCFSPSNIVDVKHKGAISITELQIGDLVRINEKGEYSRVYSLGHLDHESKNTYLQIFAEGLEQPLEISPDHFLFVDTKLTPAFKVKKGDILNGNGSRNKVSKITSIQRLGRYSPQTESGTIQVSGVDASNYVSLSSIVPHTILHLLDLVPYSAHQIISHGWTAPRRWACSLNFKICKDETYTNGSASWSYANDQFTSMLAKAPKLVQIGVALLLALFLVALHAPLFVVAVVVFTSYWSFKKAATNKTKMKFC